MPFTYKDHLFDHHPLVSPDSRILTANIMCQIRGRTSRMTEPNNETDAQYHARLRAIAENLAEYLSQNNALEMINLQEVPAEDPARQIFMAALQEKLKIGETAWRFAPVETLDGRLATSSVLAMPGKSFGNLTLYRMDRLSCQSEDTKQMLEFKKKLDETEATKNEQAGRSLLHVFKIINSDHVLINANVHHDGKPGMDHQRDILNFAKARETYNQFYLTPQGKPLAQLQMVGDFNAPLSQPNQMPNMPPSDVLHRKSDVNDPRSLDHFILTTDIPGNVQIAQAFIRRKPTQKIPEIPAVQGIEANKRAFSLIDEKIVRLWQPLFSAVEKVPEKNQYRAQAMLPDGKRYDFTLSEDRIYFKTSSAEELMLAMKKALDVLIQLYGKEKPEIRSLFGTPEEIETMEKILGAPPYNGKIDYKLPKPVEKATLELVEEKKEGPGLK